MMDTLTIPQMGPSMMEMADFDRKIKMFLHQYDAPGASVAIARGGQLIYAQGYGYANKSSMPMVQVKPRSLFRIGSIAKPITAVAILKLYEQGQLDLKHPVLGRNGYLNQRFPLPNKHDTRLTQMTITHLLQHTAGWDMMTAHYKPHQHQFDPMFEIVFIAEQMGIPVSQQPIGPDTIIQYMLTQTLQTEPGQEYYYSNFGYCLLGRVIEEVTGESYTQYIKNHILAPMGILSMKQARTFRDNNTPLDEVFYYPHDKADIRSVFPPFQWVSRPYGGWCIENMDAHGGWIGSAVDLVRFATAIDTHTPYLQPDTIQKIASQPHPYPHNQPYHWWYGFGWVISQNGQVWSHLGTLDGSYSLLNKTNHLSWAILFNTRQNIDPLLFKKAGYVNTMMNEAIDTISHWPEKEITLEI